MSSLLVTGAILCRGPHTVTGVLRTLGLAGEGTFCKYHRVLSRAGWSGLQGAKILFGLLVVLVAHQGHPVIVLVDETVERRKGGKIKAKGCYRDAVRSTQSKVVKCFGLKWICLTVLVPLPWSPRPWALPFLTLLARRRRRTSWRAAGTRPPWAGPSRRSSWCRAGWGGRVHTGRRRGLCLRRAGACVPGESSDAGVPPAPGCPAV